MYKRLYCLTFKTVTKSMWAVLAAQIRYKVILPCISAGKQHFALFVQYLKVVQ